MKLGKGFDVGTHMFVAAYDNKDEELEFNEQIDAFFTMDASEESKFLLDQLGVPYIEKKNKLSVVGEDARKFANMFKAETRRPLQKGCLNKKDIDAAGMLQVIIGGVLDAPRKEGEHLKYSVTSTPLGTEMDFTYHKAQLENIFRNLGYEPGPVQEARAIALSELAAERFTGLCISCGAGTTTVYLGHYGIDNPNLQFSIGLGGDWIDTNAADMFAGLTRTKVQTVKEKGFDISAPNGSVDVEELEGNDLLEARAREALAAYYKAYIRNVCKSIKHKFESEQLPEFEDDIVCVVAGGTSCAGGFVDLLKKELADHDFGVKIKEVRHPKNPKHAVAKGCLVAAQLEERRAGDKKLAKKAKKKKEE
jgi:actin-like ATPase involved in cell morphogenesis